MAEFIPNSVVQRNDYGCVNVKLAEMLEKRGITQNKLIVLTESSYDVIKRYMDNKDIRRVDIDLIARICYVLKCSISDILEYVPPGKTQ